MEQNLKTKLTGAALALAAAGLLGNAPVVSAGSSGSADMVHCYGVNKCNGHNDCKTSENACAGQGACKGHGFVGMPSKSCADVGGKANDSWKGEVAKADLVHCYGVNICKGHNDCKTAQNACAGQAACKGQGFVAAPSKACSDIGGETGT